MDFNRSNHFFCSSIDASLLCTFNDIKKYI